MQMVDPSSQGVMLPALLMLEISLLGLILGICYWKFSFVWEWEYKHNTQITYNACAKIKNLFPWPAIPLSVAQAERDWILSVMKDDKVW